MDNYILSYNPLSEAVSAQQLAVFIRVSREIEGWHSPFLGTYFLKSNQSLATLQNSFIELFGAELFALTIAEGGHMAGLLPASIWQWLNGIQPPAWQTLAQIANWPKSPPPVG